MSKSHVPELFDDQDTLSLVTPGKMMAMTQPDLFFLTNFLCLLYKLFELSKSRPAKKKKILNDEKISSVKRLKNLKRETFWKFADVCVLCQY